MANPNPPTEHLVSADKWTDEQRRERGRLGGIKSGETKRRKKAMRENLEYLLSLPLDNGRTAEAFKSMKDIKGKNISVQDALLVAQIQKAMKGDVNAATFVRDTVGDKPKDVTSFEGAVPVVIAGSDELEDV